MTFPIGNGDLELGDVNMIQDTFQSLLDSIENEVNHFNRVLPQIARVPRTLRELNPSSFNPRVVSIGPLHRDDNNVQALEKQKIICLNNLLRRTSPSYGDLLKSCVQKAYSKMKQIKAFYVWEKSIDDAVVAKMMVVDACFILEFIHWYSKSDEPFSGNRLLPKTIIFDLVLLENQIPLFFLNEIYECTILKNDPKLSFIEFIHPVLNDLSLFEDEIKINKISIDTSPHILSLLHKCYKPQDDIKSNYLESPIHSAVDLDRAGVRFKPNRNPNWPMEMHLTSSMFPCFSWCWGNTTLRMPVFLVHDFTELLLRNLIAYEHSYQTRNHITSYAFAMDMLVNSQEDVAKLVDSKVLINDMGSNEEAANMINNICKEVTGEYSFYCEQCETLKEYCDGCWPKNITWLRKTYFSNPWNIIALFAGIILFALTVVQTVFTITSA
ncbi:hypothetical protein Hanom_Chr06g00476591 [Helianthus anomalus]